MSFETRLIFLALTLLFTLPTQASIKSCTQKLCLLATGAVCVAERLSLEIPRAGLILARMPYMGGVKKDERLTNDIGFATTARGPIEYIDSLGLHFYDFKGKRVLDIASGNSRFAQALNLVYASSGTKAQSLDLYNAPILSGITSRLTGASSHTKGDAFDLPFEDKTQDLTLNSWMMNYYVQRTPYRNHDESREEMTKLGTLLFEQLRITADGGEARIGLGGHLRLSQGAGAQYLQYLLKLHPRVESFEFVTPFPYVSGSYLTVKMKAETPEQTTLPQLIPDESHIKNGLYVFSPLQTKKKAINLSTTAMSGLLFWLGTLEAIDWFQKQGLESLRKQIIEETRKLQEVHQNRFNKPLPFLEVLPINTRTQAFNTLNTLKKMKEFYSTLPKEKLNVPTVIIIQHYEDKESNESFLFINSENPVNIKKLGKVGL